MDKYIVTHKIVYKVAAENREHAMRIFNTGEIVDCDIDCYAVELDFDGSDDRNKNNEL